MWKSCANEYWKLDDIKNSESGSTASRLLSEVKGLVSTTVGDHVGIPGVVLLLSLFLPFFILEGILVLHHQISYYSSTYLHPVVYKQQ